MLEGFILEYRGIAEFAYFVGQILVVGIAAFSLKQIKLLKTDISTRNQRLSVEKSIEFIEKFKQNAFPLMTRYYDAVKNEGISHYNGPIGDFTPVPIEGDVLRKKSDFDVHEVLNEMELFAIVFTSKLGDEKIAFQPLGRVFCRAVERMYDVISFCKGIDDYGYPAVEQLYKIWADRIKSEQLDKEISLLKNKRSQIQDSSISPIGI